MFDHVNRPGNIGSVTLQNRFVMPAMGSSHGHGDGTVSDKLIAYYEARAKGGFGLIITEFTCVDPVGKALPGQLMIYDDSFIPGFQKLADRIHQAGSKVFMQLQHSGRQTVSAFSGYQPVSASAIPCPVNKELPRELTTQEVYEVIEKFGDAALRAKQAGFDGVEIHGAHGYLVAQFMSPYVNRRRDEFGGDIYGRARFGCDIIRNIKQKCGADFPVIFRISGEERVESGRTLEETVIQAKLLEQAGADAIHVSTGVYNSMPYMVAPYNLPNGFNLPAAAAVKKAVNIPVIAVGRINDPYMAEEVVATGVADFVALGRASLADPEFPKKVKENRPEDISPCVGCLTRCNGAPGVDPNDYGVSCMIHPFTGHELTMKIEKTDTPKHIVVIGGGVGGLETAWVAASRGHKVTLLEKSDTLGGQVVPGCVPPGKYELARALRYYIHMCHKYGVDIRLNTEADLETVRALNPDEIVVATGAVPLKLDVPNEGIPVAYAVDILSGKQMAGQSVLIVGGGLVGLETAEYLLTQNRRVTVVEMTDKAGEGLHPSIQYFLFRSLQEHQVPVLTNTKVRKFTKDGAVCDTPEGSRQLSGFDMAVLAVGARAHNPLGQALIQAFGEDKVHIIGDAKSPRRIVDAVEEAARLAIAL